jgi:hypothetical protein
MYQNKIFRSRYPLQNVKFLIKQNDMHEYVWISMYKFWATLNLTVKKN